MSKLDVGPHPTFETFYQPDMHVSLERIKNEAFKNVSVDKVVVHRFNPKEKKRRKSMSRERSRRQLASNKGAVPERQPLVDTGMN